MIYLLLGFMLLVSFYAGRHRGFKHGLAVGRARSDAEWALYLEHGAA